MWQPQLTMTVGAERAFYLHSLIPSSLLNPQMTTGTKRKPAPAKVLLYQYAGMTRTVETTCEMTRSGRGSVESNLALWILLTVSHLGKSNRSLGTVSPDFSAWALVFSFTVGYLSPASSSGYRIAQLIFAFQMQTWGRSTEYNIPESGLRPIFREWDDAGDEPMRGEVDSLAMHI